MILTLSDLYLGLGSVAIAVGIILASEVMGFAIRRTARKAGAGPTVLRDIRASLRVIATLLIVSQVLNLTGLASEFTALTVSGVMAVAISLALQTTLSNVISGILLFNDGVIRLDDTIEYSSTRGTVVRVGLRNTWIKTEEGTIAVVSNSSLSSGPLVNRSATERLNRKYQFE
jgi:small conductance mechanosensitive channel